MTLIKNYQQDILKSRTTPLLIELSKKDLDALGDDGISISLATAKELYDIPLKDTSETNLIFIDADDAKNFEHTYLLEEFINLIKDQVESIKNLAIAKESISAGLSYTTGGLLNDLIGGFLDNGIDLVVENIGSDLTAYVVDNTLDQIDISAKVLDKIEGKVFEIINDTSTNYLDKLKEKNLYLPSNSKKAIKELSKHFKEKLTPAESFRLILQLMLSVAIDMPTVIFIKNPHKLDKDSLAILSLLFSYSKDVKDKDKHTNLSIVYAYEDEGFQPYIDVKEEYKLSKKLLDEQRLFTQRYAMLERPTSDIPHIAVKSSMFVGRQEELKSLKVKYYYSKEYKDTATLETISGEPGIGKTKLVKKHLEKIRKEETNGAKQIQLSLLNQVGHSSSNTGLASLTDAIVKEASRLESVKAFKEKMTDKAKDYAVGSVMNIIKSTLGVDVVMGVGSAINDRVFLDSQMEKTKLNIVGDLDNKSQDKKQEQFSNLNKAIKDLKELSDEAMPILLFIDDMQWIDEDSAEYLLQHFIKQFNVHIVATIRPSDATAVLKKAYDNKEQYPFKVALLKKADIKIYDSDKSEIIIESSVDTNKLKFNATHLLGMDSTTLKALISKVIKPIENDETNQEILANTIIEKFEDKNNRGTANTLFTVETINMLCDEKLYTSQCETNTIEQLILIGTTLKFNSEIKDFQASLESTFKILNDKYETAFEHISVEKETEFKQKFNLMAYAVLEERLNILKIYFAEHGNAAVNTLLFSSLLGTPFNSNVVKNILEAISTTEEELLQALKKYILEGKDKVTLTEAHYEIIEEVYEILSRYVVFNSSYEYRHSLLNIFLEKQLNYVLDRLLNNPNIIARDCLYELVFKEIQKLAYEEDVYDMNGNMYINPHININYQIYFHILELSILKKASENNLTKWSMYYVKVLNSTAILYRDVYKIHESINCSLKAVEMSQKLFNRNFENFGNEYCRSLYILSFSYSKFNMTRKTITCAIKTLDMINLINKSIYGGGIKIIKLLIKSYQMINNEEKVLQYKKLLKPENKETNTVSLDIFSVIGLGKTFEEQELKGIEFIKEYEKLYKINPIANAKIYVKNLNDLATFYSKNNNTKDKELDCRKKALEILQTNYTQVNQAFYQNYIEALVMLAKYFVINRNLNKAIEYYEKSLIISKKSYENSLELGDRYYSKILMDLIEIYKKLNIINKAIIYQKKLCIVVEDIYKSNSLFSENYIKSLNDLVELYKVGVVT